MEKKVYVYPNRVNDEFIMNNEEPIFDESTICLKVRAGMYKFCYRSEWVIIMSVKKGEWQAVDCNGGFANAYSKWACIDLAKNEIKKHPNWENNTYGWWKKDRMFDGLISE